MTQGIIDKVAPSDADPIICALQLGLQGQKILIRFQVGIAFNCCHQVGDQIRTPLVLVLHLRPSSFRLLILGGNIIDATTA